MSDLNAFTVAELKEKLKACGLVTTGSKAELIARLLEADLNCWMEQNIDETNIGAKQDEKQKDVWLREIKLSRREKAIMEQELELVRREISMLCERRHGFR